MREGTAEMRQQEAQTKFASDGGVSQEGMLPIRRCKFCDAEIVWATSKRTGKRYPVQVQHGHLSQRFYAKHIVHKCPTAEEIEAQAVLGRKAENTRAMIERFHELSDAGEWDKAQEVANHFDKTGEVL
jgi:hypothetical protein